MTRKPTHGGRRAGAGRPPIAADGTRRHSVTLDAATFDRLAALGDGNVSAGIRAAARLAQAVLSDPTLQARAEAVAATLEVSR